MKSQIRALKVAGSEGVVIGVLDMDGKLKMRKMQEVLRKSNCLNVDLHHLKLLKTGR